MIDNTPSTSAATSPMFSMSGDGTDDVAIPTVFLFTQDASKLLIALSKDPTIKVTLAEYKRDGETSLHHEEQSMFHKLKVSVQEFLNKHTGIEFTNTVDVGGFRGHIGVDKIRITHRKIEENETPDEKTTNQQWSQIRKGLLHSILRSETKELFVPMNILRIYYQTLSDDAKEEPAKQDVVRQTRWLLNELNVEHHRKDDELVVPGKGIASEVEVPEETDETKQTLEKLNSILDTINQIQKNMIDDLNKMSKHELFVSEKRGDSGKVILTKEQLEVGENKSDEKSEKRATDEL